MADQSMLSLFDSDTTSFLDELAGGDGGSDDLAGLGADGGLLGQQTGMGQALAGGMHSGMSMASQMNPMQQQQGGYSMSPMPGMAPLHHQTTPPQQTQKLHHIDSYDQFSSPMHSMNQPMQQQMSNQSPMPNRSPLPSRSPMPNQSPLPSHSPLPNQSPTMISPPPQQNQFGSPQAGSMHLQSPGPYSSYTMHNSPRINTPPQQAPQTQMIQQQQQQMIQITGQQAMAQGLPQTMNQGMTRGMNQGAMWSNTDQQAQQQQQQIGTRTLFIQQAQGQTQPTAYLSHHDYALPAANPTGQPQAQQPQQQRLSHFPDQQQQQHQQAAANQTNSYMQGMGSPPPTQRLTHMPISSPNTMVSVNRPQQQSLLQQTGYPQASQQQAMGVQQQVSVASFSTNQAPRLMQSTGYPNNGLQGGPPQQQQVNSGPRLNSQQIAVQQVQTFAYPTQQQNQLNQPSPQNITIVRQQQPRAQAPGMVANTQRLSHFPQQSPTQTTRFRHPFSTTLQQQQGGATGPQKIMIIQRPGNANQQQQPQTITVTRIMPQQQQQQAPTSQGKFTQSSLQQLEQLVLPQSTSAAGPQSSQYQPRMVTTVATIAPAPTQQIQVSSAQGGQRFINPNLVLNVTQAPVQGATMSTSIGNTTGTLGLASPNLQQLAQNPNVNAEIQQLQQQIQQLYNMQQTPQTQQKMLDLQERVRTLKAQQLILQQRQKEQQQPGVMPKQQQQLTTQQLPQIIKIAPQTILQQQQQQQPQQTMQVQIQIKPQQTAMSPQVPTSQPAQVQLQPVTTVTTVTPATSVATAAQPAPPQQPPLLQIQPAPTLTAAAAAPSVVTTTTQLPTLAPQQPAQPQQVAPPTSTTAPQTILIQKPSTPQQPQATPQPEPSPPEEEPAKEVVVTAAPGKKLTKQQEKANRIIQEAIEKARASGNAVPKVAAGASGAEGKTSTPKKKREKKEKEKKPKPEKKPRPPPKPKAPAKKKKTTKPPATLINFMQKKKKKTGSDGSDLDVTPPPSPHAAEEIDSTVKRRSARNTKRKKYLDELELNLSEEENADVDVEGTGASGVASMKSDNPNEEDAVVVEKILGMRIRKVTKVKLVENPDTAKAEKKEGEEEEEDVDIENGNDAPPMEVTEEEEVEEFFVKYKNFSYLHCEWKAATDLERDKRIQMKIKRYRMKQLQLNNYFNQPEEDELFNPDYCEADRVLEKSVVKDPATDEEVTHYLVKWRALPYEDSTWELEQDVDKAKIELFHRFKEPPPEDEREFKERPDRDEEFTKMEVSPVYKNDNKLREYQLEGVSWLKFSWFTERNCILADEMGLGKTVQSITFLQEMYDYGIKGPYLVIVPLSTIGNWQREFENWTDMNAVVYHGTSASRNMIAEYEMFYKDEKGVRIPDIYKFHALVTTYEIIIADVEHLSQIMWRCAVIDEAHRLKNKNCKLMEGLKCFELEHRVLLTGTPLQNNIEELFSLLNFLEPLKFKSSVTFMAEFGELKTDAQVDKLKALLKPMMLRRLKEDVEKNLAPKEETIIEVELTNIQKKYYRAILEKNFSFLTKGNSTANVPNLMNTMMELRKCCNHPYLLNGAEEQIIEEARQKPGTELEKLFGAMVNASGKLVLIDKLLPRLKAGDHKVLVFSQMIRVLDILEDYLIQRKYLYERIDGRIRGNLRQEAIDRFSKPDSEKFVFLLCTRAGGLGINLTAADTVIIFDSDWNPQNDLQAQARCHRIGQSKAVKVYRLITRNSYEREMFDKASLKLGLDKAVLQSLNAEKVAAGQQAQMSKKEIEDLLKRGAYGAVMDDDKAGDEFCEEDIDAILKRRTQVIQIESEGKGSTFSKASFSMSQNRTDIDIDDPNFWQKWAKKADLDVDQMKRRNNLIVEMPRQRKQTARYGNQDSILDMSELETTSDSDYDEEKESQKLGRGARKGGKRRGRRPKDEDVEGDVDGAQGYTRSEFFKVEKNLLVYGWGRWEDILAHGRFKRKLQLSDCQTIARAMLLYSLQHYNGDERIKGFIWDLINPSAEGQDYKNHSGLSAPVPRGRKGKKAKMQANKLQTELEKTMASADIDPLMILTDEGYKKHLKRHSNKVLLRVRLLYYLKQEVIGAEAMKVFSGASVEEIAIPYPYADGEPPVMWWDQLADRSLLVGVFKHGYEKYNLIRQDPTLCFLVRCGPPDGQALLREQNDEDNEDGMDDGGESEFKGKRRGGGGRNDDEDEEADVYPDGTPSKAMQKQQPIQEIGDHDKLPFPSFSDLNTRLRRVITSYQRNHKREQIKLEQRAKRMERRQRFEEAVKEKEYKKKELQQRWSRREEADFYRVVSTFGVEYDPRARRFMWDRFQMLARLEKKYDHTLTEYYHAFYHMCKRVCRKFKNEIEAIPPNTIFVEPITEERANRCLARIDILNKIREETLYHPELDERLKLCQLSPEMPDWWQCGKHDKDLLIGAAKHGLSRTDYHILHDPKLSFREIVQKHKLQLPALQQQYTSMLGVNPSQTPPKTSTPAVDQRVEEKIKREEMKLEASASDTDGAATSTPTPTTNTAAASLVKDKSAESVSGDKEEESKLVKAEVDEDTTSSLNSESTQVKSEVKTEVKSEVKTEVKSEVKEELKEEDVKKEVKEEGEVKMEEDDEEVVKKENGEISPKEEEDMDTEDGMPPANAAVVAAAITAAKKEAELMKMDDSSQGASRDPFPDDLSCSMDQGGDEPTVAELLAQSMHNPALQWPKDKMVLHRLELVCSCVEKGEWPVMKRSYYHYLQQQSDSRGSTPIGTPVATPHRDPEYSMELPPDASFSPMASSTKGDGLKLTIQKKRGRKKKAVVEAERAARMRELYGIGIGVSSDGEGSESNFSSIHGGVDGGESSYLNGTSGGADFSILRKDDSGTEHSYVGESPVMMDGERMKKKRGRKRKIDKLAEDIAIRKMAQQKPVHTPSSAMATASSEERVPVVNLEDGSILRGERAPLRKDLDRWLDEHPGYMVDRPDDDEDSLLIAEHVDGKKKRRPRVDPNKLDLHNLTGEENISVINRETGKKITGAKAPPLKYLISWLDKNPAFDVDPKWSHVVLAKYEVPDKLKSRVLRPSERRKRSGAMLNSQMMQNELAANAASMNALGLSTAAAAGLMGFPKLPMGMPFGGLPNLGLTSPMMNLAAFGLPGAANFSEGVKSESTPRKSSSKSSPSSKTKIHPAIPTSSAFPLLYNPLMYNPLFAQGLGGFTLPTNVPTSFAALSQAQANFLNAANGVNESTDEEAEEASAKAVAKAVAKATAKAAAAKAKSVRSEQVEAQDLSVQSSTPQDLSVKRRKVEKKEATKESTTKGAIDEAQDLSSKQKVAEDLSVKKVTASAIAKEKEEVEEEVASEAERDEEEETSNVEDTQGTNEEVVNDAEGEEEEEKEKTSDVIEKEEEEGEKEKDSKSDSS